MSEMSKEQEEFVRGWMKDSVFNRKQNLTEEEVRADIAAMYKAAGKKAPQKITLSNSYQEHQKLVATRTKELTLDFHKVLVEKAIHEILDQPLDESAWDSWRSGVIDQMFDTEFDSTIKPIREYAMRIKDDGQREESQNPSHGIGLMHDLWMGCYVYAIQEKIIGPAKCKEFIEYTNFLNKGIFDVVFFENEVCICKCPMKMLRDAKGVMHSTEEAAIQWHGHKGDCYFIQGVAFPPVLWEQIVKKEISCKKVLQIGNMERRYVALKVYGAEKMLAELDAKLISENKERGYQLYAIEKIIDRVTLKMLKYADPSTGRVYVSFVPYDMDDALKAMAWKFSSTPEEYEQLKIEG